MNPCHRRTTPMEMALRASGLRKSLRKGTL